MWYIFDKNKNCVSISDHEPDRNDLESRREKAYECLDVIPFMEAFLENGKVVRKEPVLQIVRPSINQDVAELYQAVLDMSARLEKLEGGI